MRKHLLIAQSVVADAAQGEAVYAGAFDLGAGTLGPDLTRVDDLIPTEVAGAADLRHRAAVYNHGDREDGQGAYLYALDLSAPKAAVEAGPQAPAPVETIVDSRVASTL